MSGINFNKGNGGLGRSLPGETHISGLVVYGETAVGKTALLAAEELAVKGITNTSHPVTFYQVHEYFRINPGSKLFIETVATSDGTYTEIETLQNFAKGKLRQLAICDFKSTIASLTNRVTTLNAIAEKLFNSKKPLSILLSLKIISTDIANLPDLRVLNSPYVSLVLGQDGGGLGDFLHDTNPSLSNIGSVLGAVSKANIHESVAWVEKQNMVSVAYPKALTGDVEKSRELEELALCDGSLLSDYSDPAIKELKDKGYLFFIPQVGIEGSYLIDSSTCTALDDDFAYIENNRALSEIVRELQKTLIPRISGPIYVNPDTGELRETDASVLEGFCDNVISEFSNNGQISGGSVHIPAGQQPNKTSSLNIFLKFVPVGTLREINVELGLTLKL
ncbi:MAG: DUF2586 family protein [Flavobacteriales bacterium]